MYGKCIQNGGRLGKQLEVSRLESDGKCCCENTCKWTPNKSYQVNQMAGRR